MSSVSFNYIPQGLRVPLFYAEFDNSQANSATATQRSLLIGQATSIPAPLTLPAYVTGAAQAATLFGQSSMIAAMVQAYRNADPFGELWVLPMLDNPSGTAAEGKVTLGGTAATAGTLSLYVAGTLIQVAIANGATGASLAAPLAAAINAQAAQALGFPFSAAVNGMNADEVDITFLHKGGVGNSVNLQLNARGTAGGEVLPSGLTATIAAFSAGALDPDLSGVDTALGDELFDFIGYCTTTTNDIGEMTTLMDDQAGRWSWTRKVYGHCWTTGVGQSVSALIAGPGTINDQHQSYIGYETALPAAAYLVVPTYMAAAAVSIKADPNRPLQTLTLPGLLAPPVGQRFRITDRQTLLSNGIATMSYAASGACMIERSVTTYTKNAFGIADNSYLDVETMFTLMAVVRQLESVVTSKFARCKLAADGTKFGAGQPIVTPKSFAAEMVAQYSEMETLGWVQDTADFANGLICQINANDPSRLDVLFDPYLVGGLRVLALLMQFRLQVPSSS